MTCLLAMMMPTELMMFMAHAPTSDTPPFFSNVAIMSVYRTPDSTAPRDNVLQRRIHTETLLQINMKGEQKLKNA